MAQIPPLNSAMEPGMGQYAPLAVTFAALACVEECIAAVVAMWRMAHDAEETRLRRSNPT
jgi:hypothetical protein